MTPQEQQLLQDLTQRVNQTVLQDKDPEAEQFLQQSLGRNPDAIYILAQTVLVQQYALNQARQQLDQLQQQPVSQPAPQKHTSFLGSLLGINEEPPAPPPPPQYAPVPNYPPQPQYAQPAYATPSQSGVQSGGFLRSAMQTATGVAAGALAFQGIESLMHGFGEHAGYGSGSYGFDGMNASAGRPEEIVNNYYGDSGTLDSRAAQDGQVSPDIEDRRDDSSNDIMDSSSGNDDSSYDSSGDSDNSFDPSGNDTSF